MTKKTQETKGFSLTEVLLAVGTLAVGMLFIAGVFPVSIHFTTVSSERTIAAVVADEAFAKIKLYGILDPNVGYTGQTPYENASPALIPDGQFAYPSTPTTDLTTKRYWWSAVCRRVGPSDIQVTVFVSRKAGAAAAYRTPSGATSSIRPLAVPVSYTAVPPTYDLTILATNRMLISDGYTIVDNTSGQIYRVLGRTDGALDSAIHLDKPWQGGNLGSIWVVPPPSSVGAGRYPCIAVYQKVMRF